MKSFAVSGMHKLTTLDFPGVVSAIIFTQGCNFHCPYCHNRHLIPMSGAAAQLSVDEILNFLRKRAGLLEGLVISGGEPTLQSGLPDFCRAVKEIGYRIKLDTNGSRPEVLAGLLSEKVIDYIALDYKTSLEDYSPKIVHDEAIPEKYKQSVSLLLSSGVEHEFRTTCASPYVSEKCVVRLAEMSKPGTGWYLQKANIDEQMRSKGISPLSLEEMEDLAETARALGVDAKIR